ncbi:MAG TPA: hypothetical protein VIP11_15455, partial [Gemmatimonadaceae bacterium]
VNMSHGRNGVALFAALTLMAIVGLLIGGTLATSTLAQRSTRLAHSDAQLNAAADLALNTVLADWRGRGLADLPLGREVRFDVPIVGSPIAASVFVTRLANGVLWIVADAGDASGATRGRRRLNLVARWPWLGELPRAAIVARGRVRLASGVIVTADTTGEPDCRAPAVPPAVMVGPGSELVSADSVSVAIDPSAADSSTYYIAHWQLPLHDSTSRVVRVRGDTTLSGGSFNGVLLVDGRLTITGSVAASGLIVVRGEVDARLGSLTLTGALLSLAPYNISRFGIDIGAGLIRHSRCEIAKEFRHAIPLRPVRQRGWVELF